GRVLTADGVFGHGNLLVLWGGQCPPHTFTTSLSLKERRETRGSGPGGGGARRVPRCFAELGKNGDEKITLLFYRSPLRHLFQRPGDEVGGALLAPDARVDRQVVVGRVTPVGVIERVHVV